MDMRRRQVGVRSLSVRQCTRSVLGTEKETLMIVAALLMSNS